MEDKKHVMDLNLNMSKKSMYTKRIVVVGGGVAGANFVTKLVDNGYPGELITIIDKGKDPYNRLPSEVMTGWLGCGGWSDGKLTYHTSIGGHLSKYCGEDKAMELMDQVISNFRRFHPKPEQIFCSNPVEEPDFIKPYFGLRLFPVWHIGSNFLHDIAKAWYQFLVEKGVRFQWQTEVTKIDFDKQEIKTQYKQKTSEVTGSITFSWQNYDTLIFAVGKSGIDFGKKLAEENELPTESKPVQIGVRFEAPQKYFQKLIDISYDFKLYRKFEDKGVSLRTFCLPETELIHIERNGNKMFTNINNVTLEDKILTYNFEDHNTSFTKPKNLYSREYIGNLVTINSKLVTTEDHVYFIWEKEKIKGEYDRKDGYKDNAVKLNKILEIPAKDLKIGDRLVIPKTFPKLNNERYTKYSNDYLYLFGLWFADGSGSYKSKWDIKNFTLTNENYILQDIINILGENDERYTSIKEYDKYSVLNFYSPLLKEFLTNEDCFKKGKNRGLPKSIFNWSEEEIYTFLSGLIDGDGRVKKEHNICLDYFTVSDILYRDLTYLFNYLGISCKSRTRKQSTNFKEDSQINIINIAQRDSMFLLSNKLKLKNINKNQLLNENLNIEYKERDTKNYEKVYSIECEYYHGMVYDFEVENTHNFIAGNTPIVIHNCTNNNAAYVAVEKTYGDISYNGHAKKGEEFRNDMTNFGILMEIKDIEKPFDWSRELVSKVQENAENAGDHATGTGRCGLYFSPGHRRPGLTSEGEMVKSFEINDYGLQQVKDAFHGYFEYIEEFIIDMGKVFPEMGTDWGIYIPEVKYLSAEPLVNYENLALNDYPNVHFVGDALSARGITVAGSQGVYVAESILND